MTQYIDKDALVAEIERRIESCAKQREDMLNVQCYTLANDTSARMGELRCFQDFINTLEVKEVDFEKELDKEWDKCEPIDEGMGLEIASIEHEQFDNIAKHFFELGLKAQRESVSIQNVDDILKELGVDPYSKEAKKLKDSYYAAMDKFLAQKGEEV